MQGLSISVSEWKDRLEKRRGEPLDAVVIGSGYGGSVAALRLAEMGFRVTVLERGSEFLPGDFPSDISQVPKFMRAPSLDGQNVTGRANGLFEWRVGPGVVSVVANGVGGGSLINAGVVLRPDADVLQQAAWPIAIRLGDQPRAADDRGRSMAHWLDLAAQNLAGERWDEEKVGPAAKSRAFEQLAPLPEKRLGEKQDKRACSARALTLTIDPERCTRCGDCASGCNVPGAKRTLRDTYLSAFAAQPHATIVQGASVWTLEPVRAGRGCDPHDPAKLWRLRGVETHRASRWNRWEDAVEKDGFVVEARLVVLAAGTFGSTELLQRSRERAGASWWLPPSIGERFSANGDSLSLVADMTSPVNAVGHGADAYLADQENRRNVGPTITREISLRQDTLCENEPTCAVPLERRLTLQDGALPGALARIFAETLGTSVGMGRLSHWRTALHTSTAERPDDPLAAGHERRGKDQQGQNRAALTHRTQVVLAMGHDGSKGRIVWVPGRNASVPYWESPEKLETYRFQEELLAASLKPSLRQRLGQWLARLAPRWMSSLVRRMLRSRSERARAAVETALARVGAESSQAARAELTRAKLALAHAETAHAEWVPNLVSRPIPPAVSRVMSGNVPGCALTTAHPLGGCAMGDDPCSSVVDEVGRVWRSDRREHAGKDEAWARHENLLVLDGSIVPTSLGVNPMLTITALAERAMDALARRQGKSTGQEAPVPLVKPLPGAEKLALARTLQRSTEPAPWRGKLHERLVCEAFPVEGSLKRACESGTIRAELNLDLEAPDWLDVLDDAKHELKTVDGTLQLTAKSGAKATYKVAATKPCELLAVWPYTFLGSRWFGLVWCHAWLRTALTWSILRPDALESALDTGPVTGIRRWTEVGSRMIEGIRQIGHLSERRRMVYELKLELVPDITHAASFPQELLLHGTKHIEYAAPGRGVIGLFFEWLSRRGRPSSDLPSLRKTFVEQASHLEVKLLEPGSTPAGSARFEMDYTEWLRDRPVFLETGDLTGGLLALSGYPGLLLRFILKTRLPDFKLPEYRHAPAPERRHDDGLRLRCLTAPLPEIAPTTYRLRVPRGCSSSDVEGSPRDDLEILLRRYRRRADDGSLQLPQIAHGLWYGKPVQRLRSVLLVHAFGQSGYTFTHETLSGNLAGQLYAGGYEVWVLEHRLSTRVPAHLEETTLDQLAQHDIPAAVNEILVLLRVEFELAGRPLELPQIHVFGQCLGGAGVAMALLSGRLHHDAWADSHGTGPRPRCPKLASLMLSQTHPLCVGQLGTQARTWLPSLIRDGLQQRNIPFSSADPEHSFLENWLDRLLAGLPVPDEERCPALDPRAPKHERHEEDAVTCRRIRFIEGPLYKHANLDRATHRELPLHFGHVNVRTFAQAAKCVDAERLVDEDGRPVYVNEANVREYAALPVAFMHGEQNELFHPESALRSARLFASVHPDWAERAHAALPTRSEVRSPGPEGDEQHPHWLVPGHGHLDVLIGTKAPRLVYPSIMAFFDKVARIQHRADRRPAGLCATARAPRVGPFLRPPVRRDDGRFVLRVSFLIDDRFSEGKGGPNGDPGSRSWAFARVCVRGVPKTHRLEIVGRPASAKDLRSASPFEPDDRFPAYRFAIGDLALSKTDWLVGENLDVEAFSVHESLAVVDGASRARPPVDLPLSSGLSLDDPSSFGDEFETWLTKLLDASDARKERRSQDPIDDSVSRVHREPELKACVQRTARVPAAARAALEPGASASLFAGCCRYPGFPIDRHRVDRGIQRALAALEACSQEDQPAFTLLLGDQIYADATAGIIDPLSPTERFVERHRKALSRDPEGEKAWLGDLLATRPAVLIPDDHEYIDAFPAGAPPTRGQPWIEGHPGVAERAALDAWTFFQGAGLPCAQREVACLDAGPARVLVVETRSQRSVKNRRILTGPQREQIAMWLAEGHMSDRLHLIATASVVLPGLRHNNDPANPGEPDTFQWSPEDREWLLEQLGLVCDLNPGFRFVLLSGDYHLTYASRLLLNNRAVGAAIVTPPLYAPMPYANACPSDLYLDERLKVKIKPGQTATWKLERKARKSWCRPGSGLAELGIRRIEDHPHYRYEVTLKAELVDYGARPKGEGAEGVRPLNAVLRF